MSPIYIVIGLVVLIALMVIGLYNSLVSMQNQVKNAWSDIDVQLKRRYDLIPNLIETVKGYATHEKDLLENVTKARNAAINAGSPAEQNAAENALSGTLKSLFAVAENYPDLKANTNFLELQRELSDTENKIQAARRFYNSMVQQFNTKLESFPGNFISNFFSFSKFDSFEVSNAVERENVKVQF